MSKDLILSTFSCDSPPPSSRFISIRFNPSGANFGANFLCCAPAPFQNLFETLVRAIAPRMRATLTAAQKSRSISRRSSSVQPPSRPSRDPLEDTILVVFRGERLVNHAAIPTPLPDPRHGHRRRRGKSCGHQARSPGGTGAEFQSKNQKEQARPYAGRLRHDYSRRISLDATPTTSWRWPCGPPGKGFGEAAPDRTPTQHSGCSP